MPTTILRAERYHDFSYGHRVWGHESKCAHLHGHNGRVHFTCEGELDSVGRVLDFSAIKEKLCRWTEENWDHKFLVWEKDPWASVLQSLDSTVVLLPCNPTAELLAQYLLEEVGPMQLRGTGVTLVQVTVDETRKCSASASRAFV